MAKDNSNKKEKSFKGKIGRAIGTVLAMIMVAGGIVGCSNKIDNKSSIDNSLANSVTPSSQQTQSIDSQTKSGSSQTQSDVQIDFVTAPTNFKYNDDTNVLSWDAVSGATSYEVSIGGQVHEVTTNSIELSAEDEYKQLQIYACQELTDQTMLRSDAATYQAKVQEESAYDIIINKLQEKYPTVELGTINHIEILGMDLKVFVDYNFGDGTQMGVFKIKDIKNIANFESAMKDIQGMVVGGIATIDTVDYNSLQSYLDSKSYTGELKTHVSQGWKVSAISSTTTDYDRGDTFALFNTYGILKLEKSGQTKYVYTKYEYNVDNIQSDEATFNRCVVNPDRRTVREFKFEELTDKSMIEICKGIEKQNALENGVKTTSGIGSVKDFNGIEA